MVRLSFVSVPFVHVPLFAVENDGNMLVKLSD